MGAVDFSLAFLLAHIHDRRPNRLLQLGRVVDAISAVGVMEDTVGWAFVEVALYQQAIYG